MANIDIYQNFENYLENKKFRAFLYTPANQLVRELEMINPVLNLIKVGFHTLQFQLPAKTFDLTDLSLETNDNIDLTLDGYEVEVWVGDLENSYSTYRFIIKTRPSSMADEKPIFSYTAISSEWELQKLPIINWPGIQKMAYKQSSRPYQSQPEADYKQEDEPDDAIEGEVWYDTVNSEYKKLISGSWVKTTSEDSKPLLTSANPNGDIKLVKTPKAGTVTVTRMHTEYGVEIPLFRTQSINSLQILNDEYVIYTSGGEYYLKAYVPANIKLPIDNAGNYIWNDPVDQYQFFIYYETDDEVTENDLAMQITDTVYYSTFQEDPYFSKDGLTINEVVEDLFKNLESIDSNMRHFLGWTYDETSTLIPDIRSGLSFETTSVYEMLKSLQENYQIYIDYDTVNRTVKILPNDFGSNSGLRFEYGKYLKGINQDFSVENQINYVQGKDANGIGFSDVSWSGDNYLENYTYQLDGVQWTPGSPNPTLTGLPSRWLSEELGTELAKRKYYQELYRTEVWGSSSASDSITKRRFDLQGEVVAKKLELEQIEAAIKQKDGLIESYDNETDQQIKDNLDVTSRNTAYFIPIITEANTTTRSLDNTILSLNEKGQTDKITITKSFTTTLVRSFKIIGSPKADWTNNVLIYPLQQLFTENIKITFKSGITVIKEGFFAVKSFDKVLDLKEVISIDNIIIEASANVLKVITNMPSIIFESIEFYTFADGSAGIRAWNTFNERQKYLRSNLETQRNEKELEIAKISNEIKTNFSASSPFNTSTTYSILELEKRLDYIRTFTKIDYDNLSDDAKTELKRIRRGQVYENTDIIDSKTLFEASEKFLLENINPSITITIDSISILQAYEAQSDWNKVRIGEKVDIFVPDLKITIEAEIQEISIDFQNYKTALKIATTINYDRSFGKYFANVYSLLQGTYKNIIVPTKNPNKNAAEFVNQNGEVIETTIDGSDANIGSNTGDGESNNTENNPGAILFGEVFIDPRVDQLVSRPPVIQIPGGGVFPLYGEVSPGTAKLTNGGLYIKDENDNLRVKLTARDGLVAEQFRIDLDGNAIFSGTLAVGVDTTQIDDRYDSNGAALQALVDANLYTDGEVTALEATIATLQTQIDGAISTYFGDGVPLPITADFEQDTEPTGFEGQTWYDTDDDKYYTLTNLVWVEGGNAQIDAATPWPINDTEAVSQGYTNLLSFYLVHIADLYYDNQTGYAYRFTKVGTADPDVAENYKWIQISDSAATAALAAASQAQATADGKITVFTASDNTSYLTNVDSLIQDGDIFMPTANFTGLSTNSSLNNNYDFIQNDTYIYVGSTKTFIKLQDVENKTTGSISGWIINATDIVAGNGQITLHSDSDNGGVEPYIAMNKTGYADGNSGLFMGYVGDNGDPEDYIFKMDMGSPANYLRWTGTGLEILGTLAQGSSIQGSITKIITVTGGNRSVTYDTLGANPAPNTLGTFTVNVYSNGSLVTSGLTIAWTAAGVASGTSSTSTFSPTLNSTYQTTASYVDVSVTYPDSVILQERVSITAVKQGPQGLSGADGADGADGANGLDGADGADGANGLDGADGAPGETGPQGAGIVYRGQYDTSGSTTYFATTERKDVVKGSDGEYYICIVGHTGSTDKKPITGASYTTYWISFGATFSSVATDILFANDVYADRTINIGTYTVDQSKPVIALNSDFANANANPYITIGATAYDTNGIFLGYDDETPKLSLVGPGLDPNHLKWDGELLDLKGDLGGTIGQISIEGPISGSGITITEDGIKGSDGTVDTFTLSNNGNLTLIGGVTATSGTFGPVKLANDKIEFKNLPYNIFSRDSVSFTNRTTWPVHSMRVTGFFLDYFNLDLRYNSSDTIRSFITLNKPAQLPGLTIVYRASLAPSTSASLLAAFSLRGKLLFLENIVNRTSSTVSAVAIIINSVNNIVFDRVDFFISSSYSGSADFFIDNVTNLGTANLKGLDDSVVDIQDSSNVDTTEIYSAGAISTKSLISEKAFVTEYNGQNLRLQGDIFSYGYVPLNPQLIFLASYATPNTTNGNSFTGNVNFITRRSWDFFKWFYIKITAKRTTSSPTLTTTLFVDKDNLNTTEYYTISMSQDVYDFGAITAVSVKINTIGTNFVTLDIFFNDAFNNVITNNIAFYGVDYNG